MTMTETFGPSTPLQAVAHNTSDGAHSLPRTVPGHEDIWNTLDYDAIFHAFVQLPELEAVPYVQSSFPVALGSPIPSHTGPLNLPVDQDSSRDSGFPIPTFPTTIAPGWEYLFQPQFPPDILQSIPPVACGTDALGIGSATLSTDGQPTPSHCVSVPSASADAAVPSSTHKVVTPAASRSAAATAPGSSIPMVLEEITLPPEKPVLSSCDFGTSLTLGDALKKNFSSISGGNTYRAFPSRNFPAKLAFCLTFCLGNDFRSRKKQVTVVTSKMCAIEQPSKARLAHLVAREMERYLKEYELRQKPFLYSLDDIVLRRIDLTSRGTIQPRLYIYVRRPRSVRSGSMAAC